jgi:hypothetical protein
LASQQQLDRAPDNLFSDASSESVAYFRDGTQISASSYGSLFGPPETFLRPSNAFDGNSRTSWAGGTLLDDASGQWVRASFRQPIRVSSVRIEAAPAAPGERRATAARIRFSNGHDVSVDLDKGFGIARFAPRMTTSIHVMVARVRGAGTGPVGFTEVTIPGVDLREFIRVADDWHQAARQDPRLKALLSYVPVDYLFSALPATGGTEVEPDLRRRFAVVGDRDFDVSGMIAISPGAPRPPADAVAGVDGADTAPCQDDTVRIDDEPVAVRIENSSALGSGEAVRYVSCSPVHLASGWHTLSNASDVAITRVRLSSGRSGASTALARVHLVSSSQHSLKLAVNAPGRTSVVIGQSYDPAWRASIDGRSLGEPVALDTMTGWVIDRRGRFDVAADVQTQGLYIASLVVSGVGLVICVVLIVMPRRRRTQ